MKEAENETQEQEHEEQIGVIDAFDNMKNMADDLFNSWEQFKNEQ